MASRCRFRRTTHLLCQAEQRTTHGHPGGIRRALPEQERHLVVAVAEDHAGDECLSLLGSQASETGGVASPKFAGHGRFKRRVADGGLQFLLLEGCRLVTRPPTLVGNPIVHSLSKVRLKSIRPYGIKGGQVSERAHERVLHDIRGIGQLPRPGGQSSSRPLMKSRQVSREEPFKRRRVARTGEAQEFSGRCSGIAGVPWLNDIGTARRHNTRARRLLSVRAASRRKACDVTDDPSRSQLRSI